MTVAAAHPDIVPDLLGPDLDLVLCGTAPSRISARERAYYANPGNLFWSTLYQVGLTDRRFAPHDYPHLAQLRIGLTDLNKSQFGNDDELDPARFDPSRLAGTLRRFRPAALAFTSKTAAACFLGRPTGMLPYGRQEGDCEGAALFVMPSTSGQARRFFRIAPWQELGAFVAARRMARETSKFPA